MKDVLGLGLRGIYYTKVTKNNFNKMNEMKLFYCTSRFAKLFLQKTNPFEINQTQSQHRSHKSENDSGHVIF